MPIVNRIADYHPEITAWRRDLHAHRRVAQVLARPAALRRAALAGADRDKAERGQNRVFLKDAANDLGMSRATTYRYLERLVAAGLVRSAGGLYWRIGEAGNARLHEAIKALPAVETSQSRLGI